jgi:molybdate transport system substrate-binding protein
MNLRLLAILAVLAALAGGRGAAATASGEHSVSIAAAANFVYAMDALNQEFKRIEPGVAIASAIGSSGSLFAQIMNGAPFDLFLSADTDYPRQLVAAQPSQRATLQNFAIGRIVIWTTRTNVDISDLGAAIRSPVVRKVAIAQPRTAPYGRAARAALENAGVGREAEPKLVFGENVTQTAQFVETGNADLGLVAMSLVLSPRLANMGRWTEIAPALYDGVSLDHAAVLTKRGVANPAARRYFDFLRSDAAKKILRDYGYGVPR